MLSFQRLKRLSV